MNRALSFLQIFIFLLTFASTSTTVFAQGPSDPPQATINPYTYPSVVFQDIYRQQYMRNKFTSVVEGLDTVWYFVDINGSAAKMVRGASGGGGGGAVFTQTPLTGDGSSIGNAVRLADAVNDNNILRWDSLTNVWLVGASPYNTSFTSGGALGFLRISDGKGSFSIPVVDIAPVQSVLGSAEVKVTTFPAGVWGITLEPQGATVGQVLTYDGTKWAPATASTALPSLSSGNVWVGNGSNVATAATPSGDVSATNAGVFTVNSATGSSFGLGWTSTTPAGTVDNYPVSSFVNSNQTTTTTVTGILNTAATGVAKQVTWYNSGTVPITFVHNSGSSSAGNRFSLPQSLDYVLQPGETAFFTNYGVSQPWRLMGNRYTPEVDTFSYSGSTLSLSLKNDNRPASTVTIAGGGSLPSQEVGFGNGSAIVSDTTFKFDSTTDKLTVSSPSNKGRVSVAKTIEINPDTLLTQQTFLKILGGKSSPYTYAPFGIGVSYDAQSPDIYSYKDYVWTIGPNAKGNTGSSFDATKPMASINWETSWLDGGIPTYEWHEHWKQPDSAAIRLKSYTIRYANALDPTRKTAIDLYETADTWSLKGGTIFNGQPQYLYASKNRTSGDASFGLLYNTGGNGIKMSGSGATGFIEVTGSGTKVIDFTRNTRITSTICEAPQHILSQGMTLGIKMGTTRFITSGGSQVDFFGGFGAGPATDAGYSGQDNIGIGYGASASYTTGKENVIAGTFAGRALGTGSNNVLLGFYSGYTSINFNSATSGAILIGSNCGNNAVNYSNKLAIENSSSSTPLISGNFALDRVGVNVLNSFPTATLDVRSLAANTVGVQRWQTTTDSVKLFLHGATPEAATTGRVGDVSFGINAANGSAYIKETGANTNTGWAEVLTRTDVPNGTFNADQLSYNPATSAYLAVPANRSTFITPGSTVTPAESVTEIFASDATASTVNLNYTPGSQFNDPYTTTRWIYNIGVGTCTVQTNQAWQFRSMAGVDTTTITLTAGQAAKIIWNSTAAVWYYKIM